MVCAPYAEFSLEPALSIESPIIKQMEWRLVPRLRAEAIKEPEPPPGENAKKESDSLALIDELLVSETYTTAYRER